MSKIDYPILAQSYRNVGNRPCTLCALLCTIFTVLRDAVAPFCNCANMRVIGKPYTASNH